MPIDSKTAMHICNVIRRQIEPNFPDLSLYFIVHEEDKKHRAIIQETDSLLEHPAGQKVLSYIQNSKDKDITDNQSRFVCIGEHHDPGFLGFFRTRATIALLFLNADRFDTQDDLRNHVLHMTWHALALYEDFYKDHDPTKKEKKGTSYKRNKEDQKHIAKKRYSLQNGVILTDIDTNEFYHRNLMADIFSSSLQYLQGREDCIKALALYRMRDTLFPKIGFPAERYPFPVSLETLLFHFSESMKNKNKNIKPVTQAINITKEIGATFTIPSIKQWRAFCLPAQEMAWCGFDPETILGAAIYTNENTYVRSIADMVAENMNIKPRMLTTLNDFNPFTEMELNFRQHNKNLNERFASLISKIRAPEDSIIFLREAHRQNRKLSEGNPVGWAAHAFLASAQTIEKTDPRQFAKIKPITQTVFEQELKKINWEDIRMFARQIFRLRRDGHTITPEKIMEISDKENKLQPIKNIYHIFSQMDSTLLEDKDGSNEGLTGNITRYISPNNIK